MKIAIYARISLDPEKYSISKQNPENQLIELRAYANKNNWIIYNEYVDKVSGAKSDRDEFKNLMQDASKRKFDLVLFWSLDRFSREGVLETLNYLNRLSEWKVNFRSYQENYLDSIGPFKDVIISIMATIAKQERIRISERTKSGIKRVRLSGKIWGKRPSSISIRQIIDLRKKGLTIEQTATQLGVSFSFTYKKICTNRELYDKELQGLDSRRYVQKGSKRKKDEYP